MSNDTVGNGVQREGERLSQTGGSRLADRIRRRAYLERRRMTEAIGLANEEVLQSLQDLGYSPDTVRLIHLVPLVQVAWADGSLTRREAKRILDAARARGIENGTASHRVLQDWLDQPPPEGFCRRTLAVLRHLLRALPEEQQRSAKVDLASCCCLVAEASGGILGLGSRISTVEQRMLRRIGLELQMQHEGAAEEVLEQL